MSPVELRCGKSRVVVRPECGGSVETLELVPDGEQMAVPVLAGDPPSAPCNADGFRGRLLAPWNDRIPGGRYTFDGNLHQLTLNETDSDAMHGFLHRTAMNTMEQSDSHLRLSATLSGEADPGYPFTVGFTADYRIDDSRFDLTLRLENRGSSPAPVAMGWHPYFQLPGTHSIDALRLQISADECVPVDAKLLPTAARGPLPANLRFDRSRAIGNQSIDLAYLTPGGHRTLISSGEHTITIEQSATFPYVQVYTPPDRLSVAVEPVTGATDAFNRPELGLRVLEPGETLSGEVSVSLGVA